MVINETKHPSIPLASDTYPSPLVGIWAPQRLATEHLSAYFAPDLNVLSGQPRMRYAAAVLCSTPRTITHQW